MKWSEHESEFPSANDDKFCDLTKIVATNDFILQHPPAILPCIKLVHAQKACKKKYCQVNWVKYGQSDQQKFILQLHVLLQFIVPDSNRKSQFKWWKINCIGL